ncbi:hypothetical protein [Roseibium sp.]|uniref:hypothetical protein n=1 Tax=Roseibium sp. TaxID=1936156 RepID=UPI003A96EDB7
MKLFKEISVWRRINDKTAIRYRCLQDLKSGKYAVSNADGFRVGDGEKHRTYLENLFVELLTETSPSERCDWFEVLCDAIASHDREFDVFSLALPPE